MKELIIDSIFNSADQYSFSWYEDGKFVCNQLDNSVIPNNCIRISYRIVDIFLRLGHQMPLIYDVKILYELLGHKFDGLEQLSSEILGQEETCRYQDLSQRLKAHIKSYKIAKINIKNYSNGQLFSSSLIKDYYNEKQRIIYELFKKIEDKDLLDYYANSFFAFLKCIYKTNLHEININLDKIKEDKTHFSDVIRKNTINNKTRIKINPIGAKTGRMSCEKGSINIYTLPKNLRNCIESNSNCQFVQMDYKSFQPRLAIFSVDDKNFKNRFANVDDIYSTFSGEREKNKIEFISWMFSEREDEKFQSEAKCIDNLRTKLYDIACEEGKIITPFGRILYFRKEPKHTIFQNYITSLEADCIITAYVEMSKFFQQKQFRSRILAPFHDSIIFELDKSEICAIKDIQCSMENLFVDKIFYCKFPINVKVGDNLGDMNEIQ